MNGKQIREKLATGAAITMLTPHFASSGLAVRLVELGSDCIFLDCEHGTWSFEDIRLTAQAIRGAGGAAIVRPHSHERPLLIRYLNAGADGLMVPMVESAAQARAIVEAVRYGVPEHYNNKLVIAMIETLTAINNLDSIAEIEGVDVLFIGPGDLSQNMGFPPAPPFGEPRPAAVIEKATQAVEKIRRAGKIAGILATLDELPFWLERGVRYFYIHSDPFLRHGMDELRHRLASH